MRFTGTLLVVGGEVLLYFDWPRDDRIVARDVLDEDFTFDATGRVSPDNPPDPAVGGYVVAARQPRLEDAPPVTTVFRVPCPPTTTTTTTTTTTVPPPVFNPTLTLNPGLGPAGFVTTAVGTGWPPGPVTLGWDAGGSPITAVADADGSFSTSVLVLSGTTLGQHGMIGNGLGGASAAGGFLVVPRSMAPPLWVR